MALLEVNGIFKRFGKTEVLKGIDFSMEKGEVLAIIGSSGSGKTTLLRCLNFLETPDSGRIVLNGDEIYNAEAKYTDREIREKRLNFGLVFQSFNLFPQYTVLRNVCLAPEMMRINQSAEKLSRADKARIKSEIEDNARTILASVGLSEKLMNYPCELSGGQQQRVAIARALAMEPVILCFDEPTSALDPELTGEVLGKAIYYNGALIQAVYSASSAGYTASSKNVWGTDYPYLQSRFCDLDKQYDPNYGRKVEYTSAEIKSKVLEKTGIDLTGDPSGWLSVETNVDGFYVGQMNVGGYHSYTDSSGDSVKITGRVFRERIMSFELRSSAFDVEYDANSDKFIFTTYGYGHGVGMSQNGANALATYLGYDYKEILTYYYQGTEVK